MAPDFSLAQGPLLASLQGLEEVTRLFFHVWKVSRVNWASRQLRVPNSPATYSRHSPGPGLWELGMQRGQSLSDGTTVLALLAEEAAVMA